MIHLRPTDAANAWAQLGVSIEDAATVAVIFDGAVDFKIISALAEVVGNANVSLVSAMGEGCETFHDLVDQISLKWRENGPLTTWEENDSSEHFLWTVTFVYRGTLDVRDQNRAIVVCYVSDKESAPRTLVAEIERLRKPGGESFAQG
jgi:hypothetical protein